MKKLKFIAPIVVIGFFIAMLTTFRAFADGGNADDQNTKPGTCDSTPGRYCVSGYTVGVSWIWYAFDDPQHSGFDAGTNTVNYVNPNGAAPKNMSNCVAAGGKGYYRLAWLWYIVPNKYTPVTYNGIYQYGLVQVKNTSYGSGGSNNYIYNNSVPGSADWSAVESMFKIAADKNATDGIDWNDASAFCYNPDWGNIPTSNTNKGQFFSKSTVIAPAGAIGGSTNVQRETSNEDGTVEVKFSTDNETTVIEFEHIIIYKNTGNFSLTKSGNETDDALIVSSHYTDPTSAITTVPSSWSVSGNGTKTSMTTYTDSGTANLSPTSSKDETSNVSSGTKTQISVKLNEGETKTVCSKISYDHKYVSFDGKEHETQAYKKPTTTPAKYDGWKHKITGNIISDEAYNNLVSKNSPLVDMYERNKIKDGSYDPGQPKKYHMDYKPGYSGNGSSQACATITRPKDPGGGPDGDPNNPVTVGDANATITFAGQTAALKWNTYAKGVATRRLAASQLTAHQIGVSTSYSSLQNKLEKAHPRSGSDPYVFMGGASKTALNSSNIMEGKDIAYESWNTDDDNGNTFASDLEAKYHMSLSLKVPNEVGDKICTTAGYKFEYWWGVDRGSGISWTKDTGKDYWYIFRPSCRAIAKKPTTAIWNGGIFTSGGIKTSIADRYNIINFGETTNEKAGGGDVSQTTFGSWSEFLTVAGNGTVGTNNYSTAFTSGSIFYTGTGIPKNLYYPLTIANTNIGVREPGASNIKKNVTLDNRLKTYLKNKSDTQIIATTIGGTNDWNNVEGTHIYKTPDNTSIKITGNITTNDSKNYTSIYDLPQIVIFVDGDIDITDNVTRIDAWLIATGTINTCTEFNNGGAGTTTADASVWGLWGSNCANQLIFNGPVMANNLKLNRSFGSNPWTNQMTRQAAAPTTSSTGDYNTSRQAPAEIFNLRADTYLWAYAQSSRYDSSFTESYSRELAPRY